MTRKYFASAFLLFIVCAPAFPQFTTVTGTVTDVNGVAYDCGTISAAIVNTNGQQLYLSGQLYSAAPSPVSLGCALKGQVSGSFTMNVGDNTQIKCGNPATGAIITCATQTKWTFQAAIAPGILPPAGTGPQFCNSAALTISGASQSITSSFSACPALSKGTGAASALAGNQNAVYASPVCPVTPSANCFFVNDNLKFTLNASWTNATPTAVTCTISDCNFVAGTDNGKTCYGFASAGTLIVAVGTLTVTGAQTATCSAGASLAVNPGTFIWYNDDTANLNAAYTALLAFPHCGTLVLPSGYMGISGSIFDLSTPTACFTLNGDGLGIGITGLGLKSTFIVARPDLVWSGGDVSIIGTNAQNSIYDSFQLTGLGAAMANGAGKAGIIIAGGSVGKSLGITQMTGMTNTFSFTAQQTSCVICFADDVGNAQITYNSANILPIYNFQVGSTGGGANGGGGIAVSAGTTVSAVGESFNGVSTANPITIAGLYYGTGDAFVDIGSSGGFNGVVITNAAAVFDETDALITSNSNAASSGIVFTANGKAVFRGNTAVTGGATGGALFSSGAGGIVYAEPTVTWSPTTFPNFTGTFQGPVVQAASCTGTATGAVTINVFASMQITGTCTSVVTVVGKTVPQLGATGFLSYLNCSSSAAGVNASDGVCTVVKNGSATTITCTIGTGTSCRDNTHSVAYLANDIITIQVATQAVTTLANLKVSALTL